MLCYKDMSFCSSDCVNTKCRRFFGDEQLEGARKWWAHDPDNAPVAFINFAPGCEEYRNE